MVTGLSLIIKASQSYVSHGALYIKNGKILGSGPEEEVLALAPNAKRVDGTGFVAIPGLINAHTHVAMSFFRGLGHGPVTSANGQTTMIEDLFYPVEKNLSADLIEPLSYSYLIDGLKSGVTCFVDSYSFSSSVARAMERLGLRGVVGEHIADLGGHLPSGRDVWLKTRARIEAWPHSSLITPMVYAHATDTMSPKLLSELGAFARASDLPFQMHLSQSRGERQRVLDREGLTPVKVAEAAGVLGPRCMAVHLVSTDADDVARLVGSGSLAVICPVSEIIYENLPPLKLFSDLGLQWSLGTDCAASNDTADLIQEMRFFRLFAKELGVPASRISPEAILRSVTEVPREVLGLNIGSLEAGREADCVFLKSDLGTEPIDELVVNLVHSFGSRHVRHVMIGGRWVLWDGQAILAKEEELSTAYLASVHEIKKRAGL
jgi:5-methylthioadenosine/S-adenosylhomocysteine deaminase